MVLMDDIFYLLKIRSKNR